MERYEYEREAARGDPMPEELTTLAEACAYQAMCHLYGRWRDGKLDVERAAAEKRRILRSLETARDKDAFLRNTLDQHARLWKEIEAAGGRYWEDRTLENADAFVEAVYGVRMKKREESV